MRILLVNPPVGRMTLGLKDIAKVEPLGLEIIGAAVPDHEVRIFDMQLEDDLEGELEAFEPDIVGVTAGVVQTYTARRVAKTAKCHDLEIATVIGGHHATLCPDEFDSPWVDAVVIGTGVEAFRDIVARLDSGGELSSVPGLAIPTGDGIERTQPRGLPADLHHHPLPDRSLTDRYRDDYFYLYESPVALVQTSAGCTFPCNFCSCREFTGRRYLPRSIDKIVEDLENVDEEFVIFCDDHSFLNAKRMHELADRIKEAGVDKRIFAYSRVDCVVDNPDLFRKWSDIGLELLMTGLEAIDDSTLDSIQKRTRADINERALEILGDCGIGVSAGFVVMPDFREEDFQRIDKYVDEHPNIHIAELTPYTPLPGTPLYEEKKDEVVTQNREVYDLFHFVLPTEQPREELDRLFWKYSHRNMIRAFLRTGCLTRGDVVFSTPFFRMVAGALRQSWQMSTGSRYLESLKPPPHV